MLSGPTDVSEVIDWFFLKVGEHSHLCPLLYTSQFAPPPSFLIVQRPEYQRCPKMSFNVFFFWIKIDYIWIQPWENLWIQVLWLLRGQKVIFDFLFIYGHISPHPLCCSIGGPQSIGPIWHTSIAGVVSANICTVQMINGDTFPHPSNFTPPGSACIHGEPPPPLCNLKLVAWGLGEEGNRPPTQKGADDPQRMSNANF